MAYIQKRPGRNGTTYRVQIRVKGHPPESASFERLTDARRWAAETESAIKAGRHFGIARRRTFDDLADRYGEAISGELKSAEGREGHLARWREEFSGMSLEDITPSVVAASRDKITRDKTKRGTPRTAATVNRYLATLSCAFTYAVRDLEWTDRNPVQRVRKGKEAAGRVRFLSDAERDRLLAECKASTNPHLYLAVVLALSTGARQAEVMGLRWAQVDFERKTIRLLDGATKNGHGRVLPLTGEAFGLLLARSKVRELRDDRVFIVAATGKAFGSVRTAWEAALARAGIDDFRWHDLRHTAASYLMMSGVSALEVAKILGHRTLEMTARYSHLSPERTVELGDVLTRRLGLGGDDM